MANYIMRCVLDHGDEVRQFYLYDCHDLTDALEAVDELDLPSPMECAAWGIANFDGSEFAVVC